MNNKILCIFLALSTTLSSMRRTTKIKHKSNGLVFVRHTASTPLSSNNWLFAVDRIAALGLGIYLGTVFGRYLELRNNIYEFERHMDRQDLNDQITE